MKSIRIPKDIMKEASESNEIKKWKHWFVDIDLKTDWLERLNSLEWTPVSVCSGHKRGSVDQDFFGYSGGGCPSFDLMSFANQDLLIFLELKKKFSSLPNTKVYTKWITMDGDTIFNGGVEEFCREVMIVVDSTIKNDEENRQAIDKWWESALSILESIS